MTNPLGLSIGILLLGLTSQMSLAQTSVVDVTVELSPLPTDSSFTLKQIPPEFPGGQRAMDTFTKENLAYPKKAAQALVEGTVLVSFVIDTVGDIKDVKLLKGIGYDCDDEALRLVQKMPRWQPATDSGKLVSTNYVLPIRFPYRPYH